MPKEFKQYKRKSISEMIPFKEFIGEDMSSVSVSEQDKLLPNDVFELGYIARNPKNHKDMWYVAKAYFDDNLEPIELLIKSEKLRMPTKAEAIQLANHSGMYAHYVGFMECFNWITELKKGK